MQPTSATVKGLNEAAGGLERLAAYYTMTSNFVARLEPRNGITKELAEFIIDRVTNRLFQVDNDLVVDTESMTTFGTRKARLDAGGTFTFGDTDDVYHTIYFAADRAPGQLAEWLGLDLRAPPPATREHEQPHEQPRLESWAPPDRFATHNARHEGGVRAANQQRLPSPRRSRRAPSGTRPCPAISRRKWSPRRR